MKYKVVVFGVKDTSENIVEFIHKNICPVELVITISKEVLNKNQVSGFKGLSVLTDMVFPFLKRTVTFLPMKKQKGLWKKMNLKLLFLWGGKG